MKTNNTAVEHIAKQRKRKDLSDEMVYGSQGGVVEQHQLCNYKIGDKKLGDIVKEKDKEIKELNKRLDNSKTVIKSLNQKIEKIEKGLKTYGLE